MSCRGLCHRHERAWRNRGSSLDAFIAGAVPCVGLKRCAVAGCGRESACRRQLCSFHDNRLRRRHDVMSISASELAGFIAGERPRTASHQFSMASLASTVRLELLYGLQRRDEMPPPLDPRQVSIIVRRLESAVSLRKADGAAICESGGIQYNSIIRGMFGDLQRHLERAWVAFTGAETFTPNSKSKLSGLIFRWCAKTAPTGSIPCAASAAINSPTAGPNSFIISLRGMVSLMTAAASASV